MTVISMVSKTRNAKHWGPKQVLESALQEIEDGKILPDDRLIVLSVDAANSGRFVTSFTQCGMSASEMIMLLEIAKMDIYRKHLRPLPETYDK